MCPPFSFPPTTEQGRGRRVAGGGPGSRSGPGSGSGVREKGGGFAVGRFPHSIRAGVACGGVAMVAGGGRRLGHAAAALQGLASAGFRGKSTREPRGVDSPAHLG
jgi:hypothetical protein